MFGDGISDFDYGPSSNFDPSDLDAYDEDLSSNPVITEPKPSPVDEMRNAYQKFLVEKMRECKPPTTQPQPQTPSSFDGTINFKINIQVLILILLVISIALQAVIFKRMMKVAHLKPVEAPASETPTTTS